GNEEVARLDAARVVRDARNSQIGRKGPGDWQTSDEIGESRGSSGHEGPDRSHSSTLPPRSGSGPPATGSCRVTTPRPLRTGRRPRRETIAIASRALRPVRSGTIGP